MAGWGCKEESERMKKKNWILCVFCALCVAGLTRMYSLAAFNQDVETAYNTAVQGQDALDGLDVSVDETTVSSGTNLSASKKVKLKVSGIKGSSLKASIEMRTDEGSSESYYQNGYYYTTTSDGRQKRAMERSDIWTMINSEIYLDMTSNYLKMLYSKSDETGTTYYFAATSDTLGDYAKKILTGIGIDEGITIDSLQGTMETNADGHVQQRSLQIVYTVSTGENSETFFTQTLAQFHQNGESVAVELPDLSDYKEAEPDKPVETITPLVRTVYTTADVNVRAAGGLNAVILGGLNAGSGVTQTGYTSDGWIQIQYNEATGYIWGDYISTKKPVLTRNTSGTMYATTGVNVRASYSSDSEIIGGLSKGQGIDITGTTDNGWIRVKFGGRTGYVYADYLSWSEPIVDTYVKNGYISGTVVDASYGTLQIRRDDGQGNIIFNTMYAEMKLKDTICTGDWVEVSYSGSGTPYTASRINDYTRHEGVEERSYSVEGVVTSCTPSRLELSGSDGVYRTFDISNTDIEMAGSLSEGQVVEVTWMSAANGIETRNIDALRVRG